MSASILAWHFSDGELRFDYAGVKVEAGLVLETQEKPVLGRKGFHASEKAVDALRWFSTTASEKFILSRVRVSAEIIKSKTSDSTYGERLAAQKREHLWVVDAKASIERFVHFQKYLIEMVHTLDGLYAIESWFYGNGMRTYKDAHEAIAQKAEKIFNSSSNFSLAHLATFFVEDYDHILKDFHHLRIWFEARADNFDLNAYFRDLEKQHAERLEESKRILEELRSKNRFRGYLDELGIFDVRSEAWKNPPNQYNNPRIKPPYANDLFHKMLMQLAPEGYAE